MSLNNSPIVDLYAWLMPSRSAYRWLSKPCFVTLPSRDQLTYYSNGVKCYSCSIDRKNTDIAVICARGIESKLNLADKNFTSTDDPIHWFKCRVDGYIFAGMPCLESWYNILRRTITLPRYAYDERVKKMSRPIIRDPTMPLSIVWKIYKAALFENQTIRSTSLKLSACPNGLGQHLFINELVTRAWYQIQGKNKLKICFQLSVKMSTSFSARYPCYFS